VPQTFPVPQAVPSVLLDHAEALAVGLQIWQTLAALVAPLPTRAPSIQQPLWQVPPLHTCPLPQLAPLAPVVQEVAANEAWQVWQAFVGLAAAFA
jgi:hypothetical protein